MIGPHRASVRRLPPAWLLVLAGIGAILLVVDATYRWSTPSDEHAYWLAGRNLLEGRPIYDLARLGPVEPFAYHYPPPLAQVMAPVAAILPALTWTALWTSLLLACLYLLAGRSVAVALASIAFVPVAVELWFRNIHLPLALLTYLGLRRWPALLGLGALVKLSPGLGLLYLAAKGRLRDAAIGFAVAVIIAGVSFVLNPGLWTEFGEVTLGRGPLDISGVIPVPYALRLALGALITLLAARLERPWDEVVAVVGMTIALPTLWVTGFSFLSAALPPLVERWRSSAS